MEIWSLVAEYISLLLLSIIFLQYYGYDRKVVLTPRRVLYLRCLLSTAASILLNIVCVVTMEYMRLPLWLDILLNSAYFLLSFCTGLLFAYFVMTLIVEHIYNSDILPRTRAILYTALAADVLLLVVNLFTGILFSFDSDLVYQRGPLNRFPYVLLLLVVTYELVIYYRNRSSMSRKITFVMHSIPPIILLLFLLQLYFPSMLLTGLMCTVIALILYIVFQTHTADRDSLTGIRNRSNFMAELTVGLGSHRPGHIILVHLLSFNDINIRFGHSVGDALLYEVARFLDSIDVRSRAFRTGNVTFAVICPWNGEKKAEDRLQTICARFEAPWTIGDITCRPTPCMAELKCDGMGTVSDVLSQLEFAIDLAKQQKTLIRVDHEVKAEYLKEKELIELMRSSLQEQRFQVWCQPVYCNLKDIFCSAEALLRLFDREGNPISPDVFIPLAEKTGLIGDLTWLVLEQVCAFMEKDTLPELQYVSVNFSMQQLLDPDLAVHISQCLERHHLTPDRLKVEITERFILHDTQYARTQLESLSAIGLDIFMDDFGTGYSNLENILNFPFGYIKLDRSLVSRAPGDRIAELMLKALITLFHDMGKRVVAEGAETAEQVAYLRQCGIDMIQGFYFAHPCPKEDMVPIFHDWAGTPGWTPPCVECAEPLTPEQ